MSTVSTVLERLSLEVPIAQAPMLGVSTPEMAIAACRAGALGALAATYLDLDGLRAALARIRAGTDRAFVTNLFVPEETSYTEDGLAAANAALAPIRDALDLPAPNAPPAPRRLFEDQVTCLIEARVPAISFHFGLPPIDMLDAIKARGIAILASATNPADAAKAEAAGIDIVIAQSVEAGGHQGTFSAAETPPGLPTLALVPAVVDTVSVPVFAAGGIVDGRGIAAVLALGAVAAQIGTAFVPCDESTAHSAYKAALREKGWGSSQLTRAFSGRPARGLPNRFMDEVGADTVLPFPHQNALTMPIRAAAAKRGDPQFMSLWAGSGAPLTRALSGSTCPTGDLIEALARETMDAIKRIAR